MNFLNGLNIFIFLLRLFRSHHHHCADLHQIAPSLGDTALGFAGDLAFARFAAFVHTRDEAASPAFAFEGAVRNALQVGVDVRF